MNNQYKSEGEKIEKFPIVKKTDKFLAMKNKFLINWNYFCQLLFPILAGF